VEAVLSSLVLSDVDLAQFVKTFSRDDTFVVLYVLTKSEEPRAIEDLRKKYGASFHEMKDRLDRLASLGLVTRKGRGYLATSRAIIGMLSLEEHFKGKDLPVVAPSATIEAAPAIGWSGEVGEQLGAPFCEAKTNNSTWVSVELSSVATSENAQVNPEQSQPRNQENTNAVVDETVRPNATRSQLYL
jgi:hypothetical protein